MDIGHYVLENKDGIVSLIEVELLVFLESRLHLLLFLVFHFHLLQLYHLQFFCLLLLKLQRLVDDRRCFRLFLLLFVVE